METQNGPAAPDAIDARLALLTSDSEMRRTQKLRIPVWLFGAAGVINIGLGTLSLLNPQNLVPAVIAMSVLTALSLTVSVLLIRYFLFPPGYRKVDVRWQVVGTISAVAVFAAAIVIVLMLASGDTGYRISAAWQFATGGLCLLPAALNVAERLWPKGTGRHVA